jgi:glutamine amidotransferase
MVDVTVIDYGVGNLLSVQRGLEHCGAHVQVTSDPQAILSAKRLVLPGVGAFRDAMQELEVRGLPAVIRAYAASGKPLLGICLGMQLLLDESEEFGLTQGLGLIPGRVVPVPSRTATGDSLKIPHIGWSALYPPGEAFPTRILEGTPPGSAVYFVHSFMAKTKDPAHHLAQCVYGGHPVAAVVGAGHVFGCQFHPEKSGEVGLGILRAFCSCA